MYNLIYKHLNENNPLYKKQPGFRKAHSTERALIHQAHQINSIFEKNLSKTRLFIDLFKAFDTVNNETLIFNLEKYGIGGNNLETISLIGSSLSNTAT